MGKSKNLNHSLQKIPTGSNDEVMKIVKVLILVLVLFGFIYFLTMILTGEFKFGGEKKPSSEVNIQYTEILGGEIFNMKEDSYYVMFYDYSSDDANLFATIISQYNKKSTSIKLYQVNMGSPLNQRYVDLENSSLYIDHASKLKVKDATLLKIENGKVVNALEGKDAIKEALQ